MKTKKEYLSPALKVLSVDTEKGFAVSPLTTLHMFHLSEEYDNASQEQWGEDNTTFGGITWND